MNQTRFRTTMTHQSTQLRGPALVLVRVVWVLITLTVITAFLAAFPYRLEELRQDPYGFSALLSGWGLGLGAFVAYGTAWELLVVTGCLVMAVVIFWRKSDDWMGLLVSGTLILILVALPIIPALGEVFPVLQLPLLLLRALAVFSIMLVCFLFPDGRFIPRRSWIWYVFYVVVSPILAIQLDAGIVGAPIDIQTMGDALMIVWLLTGLSSGVMAQIYRYRQVSNSIQRQQTKWFMYGFAALFVGMVALSLPVILFPGVLRSTEVRLVYLLITIPVSLMSFFAVPFSLGISILRYRLWDIDLIVRRTLMYAGLSAVLAVVYFSSVVILQQVFLGISGERSPAAIVISTLAIAALFNPLRKRIQKNIDIRFYRSRYDAEEALVNFGRAARDEVALDALTGRLITVVEETMQPEQIYLWLKDPGK